VKPKYWYLFITDECAPCGRSETYKVRQYTPKPEEPFKRYKFHQYMCSACMMGYY
jgi:hypothetical protein